MGCEEARQLLDAYVDGELSAAQERALMEHIAFCDACREEFDAAIMLRDALKDMDEGVDVPLEAQAAWRRAIRAEARKQSLRKWSRMATAAAAALALVIGGSFMLKEEAAVQENPAVMAIEANQQEELSVNLIAADGDAPMMARVAGPVQDYYSARKKFAASDVEEACKTVEMLAVEYSGSCESRVEGDSIICRVEIPYDYMADFLSAARSIGTEMDSETVDTASTTAVISIQIDPAE